jgi:hypothetical protein
MSENGGVIRGSLELKRGKKKRKIGVHSTYSNVDDDVMITEMLS